MNLYNIVISFLVNHPAEHENEPITASDVTTDVEKFFMRKNSDEQQQQACEDDALQETQAEDQQQSEIVVHSSNPTPLQHQCTSTGSTACTVKGTKQSERYVFKSFLNAFIYVHINCLL